MPEWIFSKVKKVSVQQVGQKAANLAFLRTTGFSVPLSAFITVKALQSFLRHNGLEQKLSVLIEKAYSAKDVLNELADLRENILQQDLPPAFRKQLQELLQKWQQKGVQTLAVRSSAVQEDLKTHSFAGQYASVLHVPLQIEALERAIKQVWASLYSEAVWNYSLHHQLPLPKNEMGVILQAMVDAKFAGVAFTRNPINGDAGEIVIEFVQGLGDKLVNGSAEAKQIYIRKNQTANQTMAQTETLPQLTALVNELLRLEKLVGQAVDVEWAFADGHYYFLQYRPISVYQKEIIWTRENVGEVIPDVVTPFSWSILEPLTNKAYHYFLKKVGIKVTHKQLFTLYRGKAYFNQNAFRQILSSFYLSHYVVPGRGKIKNFYFSLRFFYLLFRLIILSKWMPIRAHLLLKKHQTKLKPESSIAINSKNSLKVLKSSLKMLQALMNVHVTITILAELYYQLLDKVCQQTLKENEIDAARLLQGIGEVESLRPTLSLWEIANWIKENERYQNIFLNKSVEEIDQWLQHLPETDVLKKELDLFFDHFGYCALHEFEISYPRWREDPSYIISLLKSYVVAEDSYHAIYKQYKQTEADRQRIVQKAIKTFENSGSKITKHIFMYLLKKAEYFSFQRENLKQQILKWLDYLKQNLNVVGSSYFKSTQDVFFVRIDELFDLIKGKKSIEQIAFLIKQRKQERQKQLRQRHPYKVLQKGTNWIELDETIEQNNKVFRGLPCSSGIAEGRACVIIDAQTEGKNFIPGDILVTRSTNPGWTPLLAIAGGIVTEIGGALSHGAIIAREFSIPMVAAVSGITHQIKTGQWIKINGQTGVVEIQNERVESK